MKRYLVPIGIAAVIFAAWLIFTLSQLSTFHALQKLQIVSIQQFQSQRPTFGWFQMNDGRLAYEWAEDGKRELTDEGAIYHTYVPYKDPKTKNTVALVELSGQGESAVELRPLGFTGKVVLEQVQGLAYPYSAIEPAVIEQFRSDQGTIPDGTPLIRMGDAAIDPEPTILHSGLAALILMAIPFGIAFLINRPKPTLRPRDDYQRYKPTWRK